MVEWIGDDRWLALVMVLTFQGWLFSLILAVLGRILPFLAAMFTVRYSRDPHHGFPDRARPACSPCRERPISVRSGCPWRR